MNHEWGREGDIIEGEYEIIEERYAEDVYTDPKGQFVETDNRTLCNLYNPWDKYCSLVTDVLYRIDNGLESKSTTFLFWC